MNLSTLFEQAAAQYGLPADYLARSAQIESSNNPMATTPLSSAKGLFQFTDSTARQYGLSDPFNPAASTDAAARLARDNAILLRNGLGRDPTSAELYLAHQQGAGGALKLLQNPTAPAVALLGHKAVLNNGGRPDMSAQDFAGLWLNKFAGGGAISAMAGPAQGLAPIPSPPPAAPFPSFAMAEPIAQPKKPQQPAAKQRGLDLAKLFSELSPNLVLGAV